MLLEVSCVVSFPGSFVAGTSTPLYPIHRTDYPNAVMHDVIVFFAISISLRLIQIQDNADF